jgi:hypothetical protein
MSGAALAGELNYQRAHFHYQMFCQGCHTADGSGTGDIPQMKDHVGHFLQTEAGRDYLVRVPGSATSALGDAHLTEVLNWIVLEFSGASVPDPFEPYTVAEVSRLRQHPLNEVEQYRVQLLAEIASVDTKE